MMMIRSFLALPLMFLAIWAAPRPAAAAEEFPVWWSPKLELSKLEDLPRRMERDFRPERWRVIGTPDYGEKTIVDDCRSLLSGWTELSFSVYVDSEALPFYSELADCQALDRLGQVRPARVSYLNVRARSAGLEHPAQSVRRL